MAAELAARQIKVMAIDVGALNSNDTTPSGSCAAAPPQPQGSYLATATGGVFYDDMNATTIAAAIVSGVNATVFCLD